MLYRGNQSRRAFLKRSGALSVAGAAAPFVTNLAAIGEAAAATAADYKAIVCIFLAGGNDYANTLTTYDQASWDLYNGQRSNIALQRDALAATALTPTVALPGGRQYALAPALAPLLPIWAAGDLAPVLNVGTLVRPTTKAQYQAGSIALPPKLFSHNDQQSYWQSSMAEGAPSGWGGRIGDIFQAGNSTAATTCVSVSGNAVFLSGKTTVQYSIGSGGPVGLSGRTAIFGSSVAATALKSLMSTGGTTFNFANEHAAVSKRSLDLFDTINTALAGAPAANFTGYPTGNPLADQLKMVARMIATSQATGTKRQVFFVQLGGFDTHSNLTLKHPQLMQQLGEAMAAFYNSTVQLGVANQVTTFTASDFGRTLTSNDDGSDHGWGSHHFVMGGAVKGGRFYGTAPAVGINTPDDVGQGRLLPSTSVDQYAATLASWFGVSASDLPTVLPNIGNFGSANLGFV
ncbi:MAG TPA: DUF1501 domain-containing protein [Sphingomonas sp.]|jgi:uncharacterized protein (DUF1501 family)|nr:DUF1501 domain-containing protein [Sphingomonas sp.]